MTKMDDATRKRVRAGRLMLAGKTPAEATKMVGVTRQTTYTWKARFDEGDMAHGANRAGEWVTTGC
ncbi:transposase [Paraburkholderia atlantica]